jgi:hypothetical protein
MDHLISSKNMLENFVLERVELVRNKALYQRKYTAVLELNKELAQELAELEGLRRQEKELSVSAVVSSSTGSDKRGAMLGTKRKARDVEVDVEVEGADRDDADDGKQGSAAGDNDEVEDSTTEEEEVAERRAQWLAVRQQRAEVESDIDRITNETDILQSDLTDLANRFGERAVAELATCTAAAGVGCSTITSTKTGVTSSKSGTSSSTTSNTTSDSSTSIWEELGKEVVGGLSLPQCHVLLYEQLGEKAVYLEQLRVYQENVEQLREEESAAARRIDTLTRELAEVKAEMVEKLAAAEKCRVDDLWSMLKASASTSSSSTEVEKEVVESRRDSSGTTISDDTVVVVGGGDEDTENVDPQNGSNGYPLNIIQRGNKANKSDGSKNSCNDDKRDDTNAVVLATTTATTTHNNHLKRRSKLTANLIAIQRARDLETELEATLDSEEHLKQENQALTTRLEDLQALVTAMKLNSQLQFPSSSLTSTTDSTTGHDKHVISRNQYGSVSTINPDSTSTSTCEQAVDGAAEAESFSSLFSVWRQLGVEAAGREKVVRRIQAAAVEMRSQVIQEVSRNSSCCFELCFQLLQQVLLVACCLLLGRAILESS